jgi:hypothetical protein
MVGSGAVPVFFAVGRKDDVTGVELGDLLPAGLDQAAAFGYVEGAALRESFICASCGWPVSLVGK